MIIDTLDWDIRDAVHATWQRLPLDVQRQLNHVRFHQGTSTKAYADAGTNDVRIHKLPLTTDASIGVLCHELGHIAGDHYRRLHMGALSALAAEQEADAYARRWGFEKELAARQALTGR